MSTSETRAARRTITVASVALAALLVGAALLLRWLTQHRQPPLFTTDDVLARAATGAAIGAGMALINAAVVARLPVFSRVRRLAHHAVEGIEPRWHTSLVVALAAGFGEEVFFRGALDPVAGRWITALAFVALHGALRMRSRDSVLFAVFLFAASIGLSALNRWQGLESAIAAHAVYDLVMLIWLVRGAALSRG